MDLFFRPAGICFFVSLIGFSIVGFGQQRSVGNLEPLLEEAIQEGNDGKAAFYHYELAKLQLAEGQLGQASEHLSQSLKLARKVDDKPLSYLVYQLTGEILKEEESYNRALNNYQRALKIARDMGKQEFVQQALMDVAMVYRLSGRNKRAIEPLEEALSLAIQDKDIILQLECYQQLGEIYREDGNESKYREFQTLYTNILEDQQNELISEQQRTELEQQLEQAGEEQKNVSTLLQRQSRQLRQAEDSLLATRYSLDETAKSLELAEEVAENQQLQIDLLNKDKELAESRIKEQNARLENEALIRNSIIIGTLLAGALVFVIVLGYRRKIEANKEIARQNKSIQGSINYAKRIQEAMLHKSDLQQHLLADSFVLFKPRDLVSGDFYWISEIKGWYDPDVVIAAVDCTGHGIPGAFMSMIGMNTLNAIISRGVAESDQILGELDHEIRTALQQEKTGNQDGMDVVLCIYRKERGILEFSGAKNSLLYVQNNEIHKLKGDRRAIGGKSYRKQQNGFKKHTISIDQPTTIYLFSDGYQDQFGGENNTKFMSSKFNDLLLEIHQKPMEEQKEILDRTIQAWMGDHKQTDDILVMGVRLDAEAGD